MSARIDIVNTALIQLGANTITSLEDDSRQAEIMKTIYFIARDAILEDANWTFATKDFTPALNAEPPAFGWSYAYAIPSDIMRVFAVYRGYIGPYYRNNGRMPEFPQSAHVIVGNSIYSEDKPIYCKGIRTMEDEGSYSPLFEDAFAQKLAYMAAPALTESNTKRDFAMGLYMGIIARAKTRDGMQNTTQRLTNNALRNSR